MLHKTGSRAVEAEGLTTQQWAVLGALSRPEAGAGMGVGELARYLKVSRQNLSGLVGRMERDGRVQSVPDERDRRARVISMTPQGRELWLEHALPQIHTYYEQVLEGFSINDVSHSLHYMLKLLENMEQVDRLQGGGDSESEEG